MNRGGELLREVVVAEGRPAGDVGGPGDARGYQEGIFVEGVLVPLDFPDQLFALHPVDHQPSVLAALSCEVPNRFVAEDGNFPAPAAARAFSFQSTHIIIFDNFG
jgi:hypothetical protein